MENIERQCLSTSLITMKAAFWLLRSLRGLSLRELHHVLETLANDEVVE